MSVHDTHGQCTKIVFLGASVLFSCWSFLSLIIKILDSCFNGKMTQVHNRVSETLNYNNCFNPLMHNVPK